MNRRPFDEHRCRYITTVVFLLLIMIIMIVLRVTIFTSTDPKITVTSIKLFGLSPRLTIFSATMNLNITIGLVLHVNNPNYAGFKHDIGYSQVYYLQDQIGNAEIAPGHIKSRGSEDMNVRLPLKAEKVDMNRLTNDVLTGNLSLEIRTRVPGRAKFLGFVKQRMVALSTCQIDVQLPSLNVTRQECTNNSKELVVPVA